MTATKPSIQLPNTLYSVGHGSVLTHFVHHEAIKLDWLDKYCVRVYWAGQRDSTGIYYTTKAAAKKAAAKYCDFQVECLERQIDEWKERRARL